MLYHFGDLTLDEECYELRRGSAVIALEPKGLQVLRYLLQQRDRVVTRDDLFAQCWPGTFVSDWALTRCLARIRKALGDGRDGTPMIKTVHGQGYRFVAPLSEVSSASSSLSRDSQDQLPPAPVPMPTPPSPPPSEDPDVLYAPRVMPSGPAVAERRVLTVLCCALVDPCAGQRDPEEVQAMVQDYHRICAEVIHGLEGTIAHYLPDEVIAYFGYPQAHDDDARRGTRAGLQLVTALRAQVAGAADNSLAVRIGIHTGLAVVSEPGGNRPGLLAVGETPALAARLKDVATPGTVVISAATARLVEGYFTWEETAIPQHAAEDAVQSAYQVVGEQAVQSRLEVVTKRGLTPFIGRDAELGLLQARWAEATDGAGQVVLLTGEPGIGKSRLVQTLTAHLTAEPHVQLEWRCSPYHQHSPWYPVIAHLHRWLWWRQDETPEEKLQLLESALSAAGLPLPDAVPLMASLLSLPLPERYAALTLSPQRQKQKTLELLLAWLFAEAAQHPVLCIVEDLHWSDPSTLELLTLLIDHGPMARLLTLLTGRPEFRPPWTPRAHVTHLTLGRLPRLQVEHMITQVAGGKALPPAVVGDITAKIDGVPLFVEELTTMVLESGLLQEGDGNYTLAGPLPPLAIPATLHGVLLARLDRLQPAKAVAQLGATIGRSFAYELLQAVAPLDDASVQHGLRQLVEAELVYQHGVVPQATYTFKHALIQDAAYQSLLRRTRQQTHQRIAQVLATQFPETAETQPELLAHHYTEAGLSEPAVVYWQRAGQRALERSANIEAVSHLTRGLEVLHGLPDAGERARHELGLQLTLALALHAIKGQAAPEVERAYARARELCEQVEDPSQLFRALLGLYRFYGGRMQHQTAREIVEQLYSLAQRTRDPDLLLQAHMARGTMCLLLGDLPVARDHTYFYEAELYRLKGELLLGQTVSDACQAEACFHHALTIARGQQAKALELRATMSLGRLWQQQGKRAAARQLLAPIYGWFSEGCETADLQEASALLAALS